MTRLPLEPVAAFPASFELFPADELELGPRRRLGAAGPIGVYVATELRAGRSLFCILEDAFVQERADDEPDLLGALAADPLVRDALAAPRYPDVRLAA
jgi:hypothetical protein